MDDGQRAADAEQGDAEQAAGAHPDILPVDSAGRRLHTGADDLTTTTSGEL